MLFEQNIKKVVYNLYYIVSAHIVSCMYGICIMHTILYL